MLSSAGRVLSVVVPAVRIVTCARTVYHSACLSEPAVKLMRASQRLHAAALVLLASLVLSMSEGSAQAPGRSIIPQLQDRFGLTEVQVRGALGALLVFARDRLVKPEFDELARTIPNADRIMQDVKLQGIVTGPLDDLDDYERSLSSLGMGQPLASQFAPAVLQALSAAGHDRERAILAGVMR